MLCSTITAASCAHGCFMLPASVKPSSTLKTCLGGTPPAVPVSQTLHAMSRVCKSPLIVVPVPLPQIQAINENRRSTQTSKYMAHPCQCSAACACGAHGTPLVSARCLRFHTPATAGRSEVTTRDLVIPSSNLVHRMNVNHHIVPPDICELQGQLQALGNCM
jgi:hypothetical protein